MEENAMPKTMGFEDLQIGQEIPSVSVHVTEEKIWKFADATRDYNPIHTNPEWVRGYQFGKTKLGGVISHGLLTHAVMTRAMTQWVWSLGGRHHRLEARFDSPVYPGDVIRTEATVTEKKVVRRIQYVAVGIVVRNQTGAVVAKGTALESLP